MPYFDQEITTQTHGTADSPQDLNWARSSSGYFCRLIYVDQRPLRGQSGIYAIWHAGPAPRWVFTGHTDDLAAALKTAANNADIMNFESHGGLYASWCLIQKEYQPGIARYMIDQLKPLIKNQSAPDLTATPIPVFPPGSRGPAL
jgi:hypothetical protein